MENQLGEGEKDLQVKVFRVTDYEWWAGTDLKSIKAAYKEATGIDPDDPDEGFDSPQELNNEAMNRLLFYEDLSNPEECPGGTFRQHLDLMIAEGQTFPCFFAGTEY